MGSAFPDTVLLAGRGGKLQDHEPAVPLEPEIGFMTVDESLEGLRLHPGLARLERDGTYSEVIAKRPELLATLGRLDLIAVLGISGFYTHVWSMQSSLQKKPEYELQVADLEFLQLLALQSCTGSGPQIPTPEDLEHLWEETRLQYFSEIERESLSGLDPSKAQLAQRVRRHSAYYRNQYGLDFFRRMFPAICEPLDVRNPSTERHASFSKLIIAIVDSIHKRIDRTREEIAEIHAPDSAVGLIAETLSKRCAQAQELYSRHFRPELSRQELEWLCHNMLELSFWLVFRFTPDDIATLNPRGDYDACLDLGCCSNEFREQNQLSPIDIWFRPFVSYEGDFYLFSPYTAISFPFHLLFSVNGNADPSFKSRLEKVRGKFLEREAADLLRKSFPSATIVPNAYWYTASGDRIETDLLVRLGSKLLVAESKGAIFPDKLRDGNYLRARTFLKDTFGIGNLQNLRFAKRLMEVPELDLFTESGERIGSLRGSEMSEVIPLVLTVEQLGIIANARKLLDAADVSGAALFSAMPIMVAELATILRLLPDEVSRVHYLSRRSRIYQQRDVLGDEMDLFTLYVMYGYSLDALSGQNFVWSLGASYSLSDYVNGDGALLFPPSSTVPNTAYFSRVLNYVVRGDRQESLDICCAITDIPTEVQQSFEQALRRVRMSAATNHQRREYCEVAMKEGIASVVLVGTAYRAMGAEEKTQAHDRLLREAISRTGVSEGILIDVAQSKPDVPFSSLIYRKLKG